MHGLFGSLADPVIVRAFGDRSVFTPDLLGYGQYRDVAPDWTLGDQADHVANWLSERGFEGPAHIVGHSVGGAVAALFAIRHPTRTLSLTSVEGNFTLADAFWSQKIALQDMVEVEAQLAAFRADVPGWIGRSGVAPTPWRIATASAWLAHQPASTLQAQARAVVDATRRPPFLESIRGLLSAQLPVGLVASERGNETWSVPDWVIAGAKFYTVLRGVGHLMMLEDPVAFARSLTAHMT